ncbi:hypothetical protein QE152_g19414 [Popillia japonica]|uniref:DDE-1 domain-containing protein n=1 Tax=Popillia japonica TaxID=7064 RepID=A0AAW1KQQ8_POPJA
MLNRLVRLAYKTISAEAVNVIAGTPPIHLLLLKDFDENGVPQNLDILQSIFLLSKAWDRISQQTIANCFAHAVFNLHTAENSFDDDNLPLPEWLRLQNDTEEDNLPLTEWVLTLPVVNLAAEEGWNNFSNIDEELETEENMTEDEILAGSSTNLELEINNDEVEMDETTEFQPPTIKLLKDFDENGVPQNLDILQSIFLLSKAWDRISQQTIANCFAHAVFNLHTAENSFDDDNLPLPEWLRLQNDTEEDNLPLTEWVLTLPVVNLAAEEGWDNFSNIDEELETEENMTEDEILAGSSTNLELEINNDEVEMDETTEFQPPTIKVAFSVVEMIQHFHI